jgi:DNA processing protein
MLMKFLSKEERKKIELECSVFKQINLPSLIDIYSSSYPPLLREIYDPPLVLSYMGNLSLVQNQMMAIVGTRKASKVAKLATELLVAKIHEFSPSIGIVSGMALGIDRQAFVSALGFGMGVVGLLGTNIDEEYPPGNRDLYRQIKASDRGLLLSEFVFPTEPARWTFPKRNRLISGLVTDVYIMESGKKSGTISTAMSALSQNREIHVFDHPLQFDNAGGKSLLSEGAEMISWEVLSEKKGTLEKPDFYGNKEDLSYKEWKFCAEQERNYMQSGNKTPLGKGVYWVSAT